MRSRSEQPDRRPAGASEDWVSRLPERIEALCEAWRLSLDDERMAGGAWGIVLCCHTASGNEAVLKLCANQERLRAAAAKSPSRHAVAACAIAAGAAAGRASPAHQHRRAGPGDWRASIIAALSQVPSLRALGRELLREGQGRPVLTVHGDLQPANILEHRGASAVIDPVGIAGPRELDVASAALYNKWGEESSARIRRLAKLTGTDPAFALRFGQLGAMYAALAPRY